MSITLIPINGLPAVAPGDDLATLLGDAMEALARPAVDGDVVVVCQKVVSKAEGRIVRLDEVEPSGPALDFAHSYGKDARLVEVALQQATEVLRMRDGHLITATGPGFVAANSAVDRSNQNGDDEVTLLPEDADLSALRLRQALSGRFGVDLALIVSDTFGRAWRLGQVDLAVGAAGLEVVDDQEGGLDLGGRRLEHTRMAVADQIAAAAGLLMVKAGAVAAVIVRGLAYRRGEAKASDLLRPACDDLFR